MIAIDEVDGLTAARVVHRRLTTLPATTTIGELRDYFAASPSRHIAVLTDDDRYVGTIAAEVLPGSADAGAPASEYATTEPTIRPHDPAAKARDLAMAQASLRVPVVDDDGTLVGVVAITARRDGFCGT